MFILQSQTTQDQLLTVEALAKGYPPPNGQQFIAEFERVAEYLHCSHLLHEAAFNKTTFCMPQDDPRSILAERLRVTKADKSTGVQLESDEEQKVSLTGTQEIYFEDPIKVVEEGKSVAESREARRKRIDLWTIMSRAVQGNHPSCVDRCVRMDIHCLYKQVCRVVRRSYPLHNLGILSSIHDVSMRPKIGDYLTFVRQMVALKAEAQTMKNKGEADIISIIPTAIICAMRNDGQFRASVDHLQMMSPPPTYEVVMETLQVDIINKREVAETGSVVATIDGPARPWLALPEDLPKGVCANWWRTGRCRYDTMCKFTHGRIRRSSSSSLSSSSSVAKNRFSTSQNCR